MAQKNRHPTVTLGFVYIKEVTQAVPLVGGTETTVGAPCLLT